MQEWMKKQVANGFAAFTGSTVSGTIVLTQELINELLAEWLSTGTIQSRSDPADSTVDSAAIVRMLKRASVRADAGAVSVDFEVRV